MGLKHFYSISIIIFLCLLCFSSVIFAQEAQSAPLVCEDPYLNLINEKIELTKQSQRVIEFKMFLAVMCVDMPEKLKKLNLKKFFQNQFLRKNNLKYDIKLLVDGHRMIMGDVDKIKNKDLKNICLAIKNNDVKELQGWPKDLATGIIQEDKNLIKKALSEPMDKSIKLKEDIPRRNAERIMVDLYIAKYDEVVAKKKANDMFPAKYFVEIIFAENPQEIMNRIIRDLTLFNLVRICNEPKLAQRIQDEVLREKSLDPQIKSISDFWY